MTNCSNCSNDFLSLKLNFHRNLQLKKNYEKKKKKFHSKIEERKFIAINIRANLFFHERISFSFVREEAKKRGTSSSKRSQMSAIVKKFHFFLHAKQTACMRNSELLILFG